LPVSAIQDSLCLNRLHLVAVSHSEIVMIVPVSVSVSR